MSTHKQPLSSNYNYMQRLATIAIVLTMAIVAYFIYSTTHSKIDNFQLNLKVSQHDSQKPITTKEQQLSPIN